MKRLFPFLLVSSLNAHSQNENPFCKDIENIARAEASAFARINSQQRIAASPNYQVNYYRCEWDIDPANRYIKGKVTSHFIISASTNSIIFDLANQLTVDSIYYHGNKITFAKSAPYDLQINFPAPINTGQKDSVTIFYQGAPPNTGFGSFNQTTHNGVPVLWTLSEPYGSRDWWPCRNGLDDKADSMDILIICPVAYKASSNGVLVSETDNGIIRTAFYKHRYPIASYLVAFGVTNYKVLNHSVQLGNITLPVITYCYPEDETAFATQTPKVLQQLSLFNQYFGEYPFIRERYGHTQFSWGGGMEHQTNSFITSPAESLMAHELGHQWFGDKVTCGSWQDIWLNEGFATYLANFHFDNVDPGSRLTRLFNLQSSITSSPGGSVWVDDTTNVSRIFSGRLSYNKGAYLVHMLRWVLGDSTFFRGLRQYLNDALLTYGFARTDDLKRNLEQISGKSLTEFFNDWFKGQGYPNYTVRWSQNNNNWARIRVNQTQSHPSVSFFEMPLALKFKNSSQEKTVIVNNMANNEIFWEDIGFVADTVLVDPEFWILTRTNYSIKENQLSDNDNEVRIFPVPANTSELTVLIRNPSEEICSVSLFNTKGQLMIKLKRPTPGRDEEIKLNIDRFPPGLYIVKIDGINFHVSKKIIIQ